MTRVTPLLIAALITLAPTLASANWGAVRDLVNESDRVADRTKREALLRRAYAQAQASVKRSPTVSNEYLWLANAAGRLAQIVGSKEKIQLAKVVKENAEIAVRLDPKNGAAHMTLGAWHFYVADVGWVERNAAKALFGDFPNASFTTAVTHLSAALKHGVDNVIEVYWLRARAYEELDQDAKAAADYRACLARTATTEVEKRIQQRAREAVG